MSATQNGCVASNSFHLSHFAKGIMSTGRLLLSDSGMAGCRADVSLLLCRRRRFGLRPQLTFPLKIVTKISPVSADRFTSASGHRRASFISKPSWPLIRQIILSVPRSTALICLAQHDATLDREKSAWISSHEVSPVDAVRKMSN